LAYLRQKIGHNPIARPLREETNGDENKAAVAIARGGPELRPAITLKFFLKRDSLLNFIELHIDQSIILVALSMNIC
jgi:hypothetical protein